MIIVSVCFILVAGVSSLPQPAVSNRAGEPLVTIPSLGQVLGSVKKSVGGIDFLSFRGIPYANAPVGDLRFKDPVPADSWSGVLNGTMEGPFCPQFINQKIIGVEDCLKLNVFTRDLNPSSLKNVLVWIHGGGFFVGSGNGETDNYGPGYFMDRDIVMVTINYRLGVLGFLTTEDSEAPGNYGVLDQSLALKWVRNNIRSFGGDPNSVTIFGESAGGAGVQFQVLSPYSKGLFQAAISQSGSVLCPWALRQSEVGEYSRMWAEELNCPVDDSKAMIACLRQLDANLLTSFYQKHYGILGAYPIGVFSPRVDVERANPFLPDNPKALIETKRFNSVPYIEGVNRNEGAGFAGTLIGSQNQISVFNQDPLEYMSYMLTTELREDRREISQKVMDHYFNQSVPLEDQIVQFEQMISDRNFNKGLDDSVKLFSKYSDHPVYYYLYSYVSFFYNLHAIMGVPQNLELGVGHASDLMVMFTNNMLPPLFTPDDIKVKNTFIDLWTSFAANKVPTSPNVNDPWLPVVNGEVRYMRIDPNPAMISASVPFADRLPYWDTVLEN